MVGAIAVFNMVRGIIKSAPDIKDIDATPTGYLSTVLDNNENEIATLVASGSNRVYVTIDEIPKDLQHAFVAIEDERFTIITVLTYRVFYARESVVSHMVSLFRRCIHDHAAAFEEQCIYRLDKRIQFSDKLERKLQEQYLAVQLENP